MIDAVLSYHADGLTCGVTRFSQQLAKRLGVLWHCLRDEGTFQYPLWSIKPSEMGMFPSFPISSPDYSVFLHDWPVNSGYFLSLIASSRLVYVANSALGQTLMNNHLGRAMLVNAWCPSLVEAQPREPITVLSFGMAHKLRTDLYATLKAKLDAIGEPYVVYVSAALHDGTNFSDAAQSFETLRQLFGQNFVFLGTLSDEAMVDRLRTCTYVAAFFEHGLRENNTSVLAALDHGASVLTNHDTHTPFLLRTCTYDVTCHALPYVERRQLLRNAYGWDKLVALIRHGA